MRRTNRGSAMVELAVACLVGSVLISGTMFIGRVLLSARRAHALARHGAALAAAGVPTDVVNAELRDYAVRLADRAHPTWTLGRYLGSASARFYRLIEAAVSVDIELPPLLGGGRRTLVQRAVVEEDAR